MKKENKIEKARVIFKNNPTIKLVYLFGSQARGGVGVLSDYDFAVFADEKNISRLFDLKLDLLAQLSKIFGDGRADMVILNTLKAPEMKYNIIKEGVLLYEKEPFRVLVEPKILNEYFDFHQMLLRHKLTKI